MKLANRSFIFILLVGVVTGCSGGCGWHLQEIEPTPCFEGSRLIAYDPPCNSPVPTIQVQFLDTACGRFGYLSVYSGQIPPIPGHDYYAAIAFKIGDEVTTYPGYRMAGYQRLLMPPEATEKLYNALSAGCEVTITLEGYQCTLPLNNWDKCISD